LLYLVGEDRFLLLYLVGEDRFLLLYLVGEDRFLLWLFNSHYMKFPEKHQLHLGK
jgi:hypothetical protein